MPHHELWRAAGGQLTALAARLATLQAGYATEVARLQTIPGVGPIVALTAVAMFSDVRRFPDARHVASYAGLVPSTYQSGDIDRHGRITRRGSGELRAMLCEAAHQAARPTSPLHPFLARVAARRGYKMAITALAHRLCRIMFAMLRDGADFDLRHLGVEPGPFRQTIVRPYRLTPRGTPRRVPRPSPHPSATC